MKSVLVIEDDKIYREQLAALLAGEFEIMESTGLRDGIVAINSRHFDAVILDPGLPDCRREEAVSAVKQANPSALVLVLSGYDKPEAIRKAIEDNASGYFIKGRDDETSERLSSAIRLAITTNQSCQTLDQARRNVEE